MITADKINKILDEATALVYHEENNAVSVGFLLGKALVYAVIYAAELIAKSIRNSS